jgi:hypothetical protein
MNFHVPFSPVGLFPLTYPIICLLAVLSKHLGISGISFVYLLLVLLQDAFTVELLCRGNQALFSLVNVSE